MIGTMDRRQLIRCGGGLALGTALNISGKANAEAATTVRVLAQAHPATEAMRALAPGWSAKSGIKVTIEDLGAEQLLDKLRLTLSSGSDSYDVIGLFLDAVAQYESAGWLEPLQNVLAEDVNDPDFIHSFVNGLTSGGKTVGLPFYGESTSLTYNKDMFAAAGIKTPPKTFAELKDYAAALTNTGKNQYGITLRGLRSGQNLIYIWTGFFRGFGGEFFDADLNPIFDSDAGAMAVDYYAELINKYAPPGTASAGFDVVQGDMQQGIAAMNVDATNFGVQLEDPSKSIVVGKIGYAPIPSGPAGAFPSLFVYGLAIPAASSRKPAAAQFVRWACGASFQLASVTRTTRGDVTRKSTWDAMGKMPQYGFDNGNWIKTTLDAMAHGSPDYRPRLAQWPAAADILSIAISSVIAGQAQARPALKSAADQVRTLMKK